MHKITGAIVAIAIMLFATSAVAEWKREYWPEFIDSGVGVKTLAYPFPSQHVQTVLWQCRDRQTMYLVLKQGVWPTMQGPGIRARLSGGREIAPPPLWLPGRVIDGGLHVVQLVGALDEWPDWMANTREMSIDAHFQRLGWLTLNIPLIGLASEIAAYCS